MQAIDELNQLLGIGPPRAKLPPTLERSGYQAVRQIGKGGFGQAHLVFHKNQQRYYVAKHVNLAGMTPKQRKEAHNEITMLQRLDHPNIVRYIEYVEEGPHLYIIMEYADGGDLFGHLKKVNTTGKRLTEEQVMALFTQVAMAVKHMHDRRMLHRDIKTQNVFLTKSHVVKLGDFGISTVLNNTMAMAQTMCGTPCYFSPELCAGKPYNNKSDIWALGVLLYEICTAGDLPFESANMKTLMDAICKKTPKRVPSVYSDSLANLVAAMLNKDPKQRPDINGVLTAPVVVKACPSLLDKLKQLAQDRPPSARGGSEGPEEQPATRKPDAAVPVPAPPPRAPKHERAQHHDDARDVMLAEPPSPPQHKPPVRTPARSPPAVHAAPPPPDKNEVLAPHKHFADTAAGEQAVYKPALLQEAARRAAAEDDDNPNCDPGFVPKTYDDDLERVVDYLATMRDQAKQDDVIDEVGPAVQHGSVSVMTDVVEDDVGGHQSVEFEDPMGVRVDLDEANKVGSPMVRKQPPSNFNKQGGGANGGADKVGNGQSAVPLRLTAKQKSVLREFADRNGAAHGAAAAAVAQKSPAKNKSPGGEVPDDVDTAHGEREDEEDDACIGGHCMCGASVYAAWLSAAVGTFKCDCMTCRRFSGNVKGCEWIHFPEETFTELLQQSPDCKTFAIVPNSIELYFCGKCGSSLAMLHEGIEGCIVSRATLSDSSAEIFNEATRASA
jgi:serine/threonine protein kinase